MPVTFAAEGKFSGPVVFVGYGMKNASQHYDDYAGIDVKGKLALAMRFEPHDAKGNSRFEKDGWSDAAALGEKAKAAAEAGAVALLIVTPMQFHGNDDRLVPFSRRSMIGCAEDSGLAHPPDRRRGVIEARRRAGFENAARKDRSERKTCIVRARRRRL